MELRTIITHARLVGKDKQKFIACSANINGVWFKIKFVKTCEKAPKEKGLYELTIDLRKCSLENGRTYKRADGTIGSSSPVIWVREIADIRKYTEEELAERDLSSLQSIFGE